jgi:hypothetical protein
LLRHQGELFEFVRVPDLDVDNNRAERLLRPRVIGRKISGETRSPTGTRTRMGLSSLFATWQARGLTPFHECLSLLHSRLLKRERLPLEPILARPRVIRYASTETRAGQEWSVH